MQNPSISSSPRSRVRLLLLGIVLLLAAILFAAAYRVYYQAAYPIKYEQSVLAHSKQQELSPALIYAIIHTESGFRPEVESSVGARGLMQITGDTYDWVKYRTGKSGGDYADLYLPERNIEYGTALIRLLLDEFGGVENMLCAYHAGFGNAKEWLANPSYSPDGETIHQIPFGDTKRYVAKVLDTWRIYQQFYQID